MKATKILESPVYSFWDTSDGNNVPEWVSYFGQLGWLWKDSQHNCWIYLEKVASELDTLDDEGMTVKAKSKPLGFVVRKGDYVGIELVQDQDEAGETQQYLDEKARPFLVRQKDFERKYSPVDFDYVKPEED